MAPATSLIVGVLALQGGFQEHVHLLRKASAQLSTAGSGTFPAVEVIEVRTADQLSRCDALVIPGGESTTISLIATQTGLMAPLKDFVKVARKPGGQELIGGLAVRVRRNHFGRQIESFISDLDLPFLAADGPAAAPQAPPNGGPGEDHGGHAGDIIAVRQGNILGMSFHPELTPDERIHAWWLKQVVEAAEKR
ncbi:unnamed protein product [Parascedosporium putredinis]|uniref:glutaminase n=1 Tax=Parascedosporium putredinis TaxID=1442378 RepID=A0A9P1H8E4_9PEZI|nr:unnamed protein product [Parascedosporium putredinis]CAI7999771.1 unnamed protein product [Parascedosporium putredinis]